MPNNQIFPWSKWYNVLLIFAYFAHIFHSPCKINAPCGCHFGIMTLFWCCKNSWTLDMKVMACDGLSLVGMLICMCLNLLFTFLVYFCLKAFIFAIPVICQATFSLVLHGWLLFFVLPLGFWTSSLPHWSCHDMLINLHGELSK